MQYYMKQFTCEVKLVIVIQIKGLHVFVYMIYRIQNPNPGVRHILMTLILNKPLNLYLPLVSIPHELCYSRGQKEKLVEFSATFHSMYRSFQMIRIPHVNQPQAVLLPSFSLWHRRPVFGKWLPLALPFGKSSSQSQQISELIHLEGKNMYLLLNKNNQTSKNVDS